MKFSDGQWCMRPGIQTVHPVEVNDAETDGNILKLLLATRPGANKGAVIGAPVLQLELRAPRKDIISVKLVHFAGTKIKKPCFELSEDRKHRPAIEIGKESIRFTSGELSAVVDRRPASWSLTFFYGGRLLTGSGQRNMTHIIDTGRRESYTVEQLQLAVGELVYGLGERFTPVVKNGQTVEIWNADGGTNTELAYKNIPFYMTNRGYGVFVNSTGAVSFEIGSEKVTHCQFSLPGEELEYMVIGGDGPRNVLANYSELTGKPALPPSWSFGLWLSTSFQTEYDDATVASMIDGMIERNIPLSVFHFDCFWMKAYRWCDFQWDRDLFPDPEKSLQKLKTRGIKVCVWINPYIAQNSTLFDPAAENGYLLKKPNGDVWQTDDWQGGMGIVDFTNPDAVLWFQGELARLIDMGVDTFKTDFGERIPVDVVYHDGSDPVKMHNYYTFLYNRTVFEVLEAAKGQGNALVFARSATVGSQKFPVHWGGDSWARFDSMAETLRGGLSLAFAGFGFWSHDIGGFEKTAEPDLYKRWCAFGLLCSHSRLHGSTSYRVPWAFDEESVDVLRHFTRMKCRLMPYIFETARIAHETGVPLLRPMQIEFPSDRACDYLDRQFMLGESLLVAPVFSETGEAEYYLPEGTWYHMTEQGEVQGGRWIKEKHDYFGLPLLLKPGTLLITGADETRPDYDYADGMTVNIFGIGEGMSLTARVPDAKGRTKCTVTAERKDDEITVQVKPAAAAWSARVLGSMKVESAGKAKIRTGDDGGTVDSKSSRIILRIDTGHSV